MGDEENSFSGITLVAEAPYSNQGKTAGIRDRPVHATRVALTSIVLCRPDNVSCTTVHSHFITMLFAVLSFAKLHHVEGEKSRKFYITNTNSF
jgi:hypothetical protein